MWYQSAISDARDLLGTESTCYSITLLIIQWCIINFKMNSANMYYHLFHLYFNRFVLEAISCCKLTYSAFWRKTIATFLHKTQTCIPWYLKENNILGSWCTLSLILYVSDTCFNYIRIACICFFICVLVMVTCFPEDSRLQTIIENCADCQVLKCQKKDTFLYFA